MLSTEGLFEKWLSEAKNLGSSDVYFELHEKSFTVKYKLQNGIHTAGHYVTKAGKKIITKIKILAKIPIAKRVPQEGSFSYKIDGENCYFRISCIPVQGGETICVRTFYDAKMFNLDKLGIPNNTLEKIKISLKASSGLITLTGPTGSGKTTTLYAILNYLNHVSKKLITIEDPIEYQLENVVQIEASPQIGLNYPKALSHVLRQDPDVIMIGEIRDAESAQIAIQAALSGHSIFTTIHSKSSADTIMRLEQFGLCKALIAASLNGILSQRLIQKICPHCKITTNKNNLAFDSSKQEIYEPKGCEKCNHKGYIGQFGIFEFMQIEESLKHAISEGKNATQIQKQAILNGMQSLRNAALNNLHRTSLSEIRDYL